MRKAGWMKRTLRAVLHLGLAGWLVVGGVTPAYADFWDDLGRAAEAVATGGLSEVARALIDTIRRLIDLVTNVTNNLARDANQVANAAADGIRSAVDDARHALDQARRGLDQAKTKAQHELDLEKRRKDIIGQMARTVPAPAIGGAASSAPALKHAAPGAPQTSLPRLSIAKTPTPGGPVPVPYPNVGPWEGGTGAGGAANIPLGGPGPAAGGTGAAAGGATIAASMPADPAALLDAMTRAEQKVRELEREVARDVIPVVQRGADTAIRLLENHLQTAANIARTILEAPLLSLKDMLDDLIKHPERLFNPTDLVNRQIDAINRSLVNTMNRIADEVTRDATRTINDLAHPLGHAHDKASNATKVADAMTKLRHDRSKAALDHLQELVGPPSGQGVGVTAGGARVAAVAHPIMLARLTTKIDVGKTHARVVPTRITQDLTRQWAEAQRLHAAVQREAQARGDLAVHQRVSADLAARLGGKSPAEQDAIKSDLIREARRRFAGNPQVLAAAERIINQGAVPGPPPILPAQGLQPGPPPIRPAERLAPEGPPIRPGQGLTPSPPPIRPGQ